MQSEPKYTSSTQLLQDLLDHKFTNVLNSSVNSVSNDSKLFQLYNLSLSHVLCPESTVFVRKKIESETSQNIVKSLSSIRSIVTRFEGNEHLFLETSNEPVLLQKAIDGNNIRVHVIDDECYPVRILSKAIDYRYDKESDISFKACELPEDIVQDCLSISKQLKLKFCGIDLIQNQDKYFVLEANPSPAWTYFEEKIDHTKMSEKLIKVLSND